VIAQEGCSLVIATNGERVLQTTLLKSVDFDDRCEVIGKRGFASAPRA
jgi:hypothetical protein